MAGEAIEKAEAKPLKQAMTGFVNSWPSAEMAVPAASTVALVFVN